MSDTTQNFDLLEEFKRYAAEKEKKSMEKCPSCGYCPHCGHRPAQVAPYWPYYPSYPVYPTWRYVPTWTLTTSGGTFTSYDVGGGTCAPV